MNKNNSWRQVLFSGTGIIILLALALFIFHMFTNHQYGFHRDELATIDDARYLDWGYIAYPPLTPFLGRISLELFGLSMVSVRVFPALAQSIVLILGGLMVRELGGSRLAQVVGALAVAISPISLVQGSLLMYVSFDYLWWILIAYLLIRLLKSDDPRWWLAMGIVIGLGMLTKYTMVFYAAALAGSVLLTKARRHLASPWLWAGVALSLLIFLPNLLWQIRHDLISWTYLNFIHQRDIHIGRTSSFLLEQVLIGVNPLTVPLALVGLYYFFFNPEGIRYRLLGWLYLLVFAFFFFMEGRGYYIGGAYPMLLAGGTILWEKWIAALQLPVRRFALGGTYTALLLGGVIAALLFLPLTPINSPIWKMGDDTYQIFREELGWQELVETVAEVYSGLPSDERSQAVIFAGNYGEAGAINLFGPEYGLPKAIGSINSYWLRGYGSDPSPGTVIVLGESGDELAYFFDDCKLATGPVTNRYNVENEESSAYPGVWVCHGMRKPWPEIWDEIQDFG